MKQRIRLTESDLHNIIRKSVKRILRESDSYSYNGKEYRDNIRLGTDLNSYVPKKAFKMVDKVNVELSQLKQMTGDEFPEILDTSSGTEMFIQIISDVVIENGHLKWTEKGGSYHDWHKVSIEDWNLVREDEVDGYWFDEYEFKDQISYLRSGIRKATKYFKEYNPDWDENERKREEFIGDL